ncbi:MAG: lamin tail domain-containing protein, partial [Planctomycetales bacterium]|nr:lamin tail domain-containing protein [Planctomycetales bacterium]
MTRSIGLAVQRGKSKSTRVSTVEQLEDRQLLTVVISEFLADNKTNLADVDGEYSDWIELTNNGAQDVDLSGW